MHQCLVCGPAKENWMKKSQNMHGLAWQYGFDPTFLHKMQRQATIKPNI
jgi:hypothetical protein